jgi:hypothetical protein
MGVQKLPRTNKVTRYTGHHNDFIVMSTWAIEFNSLKIMSKQFEFDKLVIP